MEITYKKGNRVTIKDGSSTKMATVVADGLDSQKRVRVRVDGFLWDMSITTNQSSNVYVIEKMAKGSTVKGWFGKAKDLGYKGIKGAKSGYAKAKDKMETAIHNKKKGIALDVIDATKDKVVDNKRKMILKGAEEIVDSKYAKGSTVKEDVAIFIQLGITNLPKIYGVYEWWIDSKLTSLGVKINNKSRNKLCSELQSRFMDDWENGLLGFSPDKKSIVFLEFDYDNQKGLEEKNSEGDWVAKKGSKYTPFTNKMWKEYYESIADDEELKFGNGGGVAVSSESGLAVGTNADLLMNQNNLQYGSGGAIKSADEGTGSTELREMAQVKIDKGMTVIDFSYTDYGGSFGDKVAIAYFKKHYPKNILLENSGYNGQNAFVFGKVADEYLEETKNYPLGFEDMEEFYFNMQMRMEEVEFKSFVKQLKSDGYKVSPNTFDWLIENKGGYYHIEPNMVDYSPEDLTEELIEEGLVSKKFGNGGGVAVSSGSVKKYSRVSEMDSVEDTKSHFGYDNESWNELSKEEKIKMRKLAKEHLLLGAKSNESSPYWDYSIGGL